MISISKPKLEASLVIIIATTMFLIPALATPSPSTNTIVTPGSFVTTCDYIITMDGTTPIARIGTARVGTPGDNTVGTAGQDMGAFLNSITQPKQSYCFTGGSYLFTTSWTILNNDTALGLGQMTVFKANANNIDGLIRVATAGGTSNTKTMGLWIANMQLSSNGFTGLNGINLNNSLIENDLQNMVDNIHFEGTGWNYIVIMDGNEASKLSNIYFTSTNTGDISVKTAVGDIWLDHIDYGTPVSTTAIIHVINDHLRITNSIINGLVFEDQMAAQNGGPGVRFNNAAVVTVENTFIANGDPSGMSRFVRTQPTTFQINTLKLKNDFIGLGNNGALFAARNTGSQLTISNFIAENNEFINVGGTGSWADTNGATGIIVMPRVYWSGNWIQGTILAGSYIGCGCGNYYFAPEPAGFGQTAPCCGGGSQALPSGIGSGNSKNNVWPWPIIIYMNITSSTGTVLQTGIHIKDINLVDAALLGNPQEIKLFPNESVYFATNVPYAWKWYGDQW